MKVVSWYLLVIFMFSFQMGSSPFMQEEISSYSSIITPQGFMIGEFCQNIAATAEEIVLRFGNDVESNDNFTKIRHEFDSARRSFLKIPEALNLMRKMNPEA
ncbi:hypothetical protein MKW98_013991 [Papaver atlanticum]|uniref:Uncharacterized protein n=1 Tax=Papaver atlanticum TaxID=357466 RepID=A0AAD4SL25_9MAGN|nr:hypothetical protein MKW98_013991 [Papaver atlanticum]